MRGRIWWLKFVMNCRIVQYVDLFYQFFYFVLSFNFFPIFVLRLMLIMMGLMNYNVNAFIFFHVLATRKLEVISSKKKRLRRLEVDYYDLWIGTPEELRGHATCRMEDLRIRRDHVEGSAKGI